MKLNQKANTETNQTNGQQTGIQSLGISGVENVRCLALLLILDNVCTTPNNNHRGVLLMNKINRNIILFTIKHSSQKSPFCIQLNQTDFMDSSRNYSIPFYQISNNVKLRLRSSVYSVNESLSFFTAQKILLQHLNTITSFLAMSKTSAH